MASIGPSALASKRGQSRSVGEGWGLEQWRCWGRKKYSLESSICKLNGALKARIADLETQISAAAVLGPIEKSSDDVPTSRFGSFGNEDCDPLRKNDPWMNCGSQGVGTVDTAVKEPWAAWQPQRLRRGRVRKFSLQHVPLRHWGDSSVDACDECCTSLVAQPSSAELGLTPMGIGRGEEDSNAKGDWRSMPCDTFESLYTKFPDSPLRTMITSSNGGRPVVLYVTQPGICDDTDILQRYLTTSITRWTKAKWSPCARCLSSRGRRTPLIGKIAETVDARHSKWLIAPRKPATV